MYGLSFTHCFVPLIMYPMKHSVTNHKYLPHLEPNLTPTLNCLNPSEDSLGLQGKEQALLPVPGDFLSMVKNQLISPSSPQLLPAPHASHPAKSTYCLLLACVKVNGTW